MWLLSPHGTRITIWRRLLRISKGTVEKWTLMVNIGEHTETWGISSERIPVVSVKMKLEGRVWCQVWPWMTGLEEGLCVESWIAQACLQYCVCSYICIRLKWMYFFQLFGKQLLSISTKYRFVSNVLKWKNKARKAQGSSQSCWMNASSGFCLKPS